MNIHYISSLVNFQAGVHVSVTETIRFFTMSQWIYRLVGGVTIGVEGVELEEVEPGVRVVEVEDVGELERVGCGELGGVL